MSKTHLTNKKLQVQLKLDKNESSLRLNGMQFYHWSKSSRSKNLISYKGEDIVTWIPVNLDIGTYIILNKYSKCWVTGTKGSKGTTCNQIKLYYLAESDETN